MASDKEDKWVAVPPGTSIQNPSRDFQDDDEPNESWRDPDTTTPASEIFANSPVMPQPVSPVVGLPVGQSEVAPATSPRGPANTSNYAPLKGIDDKPVPSGAAFDADKLLKTLASRCSETTGSCLHNVADALLAAGYDARAAIDKARREGIAPRHSGSYWAKDMIPVLDHDPRFGRVAQGFGAKTDAPYVPKVGDIAVWKGGETGPYGHIQVCIGFDGNGVARWRSDFTTSAHNWTGMRDPGRHGGEVVVYRQNTVDNSAVAEAKKDINRAAAMTSLQKPAIPPPAA